MLLDLVKSSRSFRGFCRDRKISRRELETVVVTDARDSITYYRDQGDVHYVPKRTLEELILNK